MVKGEETRFASQNSENVGLEPSTKEARIGSEGYGKKEGRRTPHLARIMEKFLFRGVLIYCMVCEDAYIVVSVCRFSRQSHHWLSACLIAQ